MRIVVALGGNALLQRGEPLTAEGQRRNARLAAASIAQIASGNELVITHGNGPQIGFLALQAAAAAGAAQPLDVLGAETHGMIGYILEQELANELPAWRVATLLTQTEVDPQDAAFNTPTKFIGPVYEAADAERLAALNHWHIARDGKGWRRVVASPEPKGILEISAIEHLVTGGFVTICAGGGGIPVARTAAGRYDGVECVVDKDYTSALLAHLLQADCLLMLTDVAAVQTGFGTPEARQIRSARPGELAKHDFPAGSMGPKVTAACRFVTVPGRRACIGRLDQVRQILAGTAGTTVTGD
jgi:carbamate kinase